MNNKQTYSIYKFEFRGNLYKVLLKNTEERGNSHIYPILVNNDSTIKTLPFYLGHIDIDDMNSHIKHFKYVSELSKKDYEILHEKWPFVKMFTEQSVNIIKYENIDKNYIE